MFKDFFLFSSLIAILFVKKNSLSDFGRVQVSFKSVEHLCQKIILKIESACKQEILFINSSFFLFSFGGLLIDSLLSQFESGQHWVHLFLAVNIC